MIVKIVKITFITSSVLLLLAYLLFYFFTAPKSDKKVLSKYKNSVVKPILTHENFEGFDYRKIKLGHNDDLPTVVFIHGTIGSLNDFNAYLSDSILQTKANFIAYDRIGYNYNDKNNTQESIDFEKRMLDDLIKGIASENIVLVGYSFGGPIALSYQKKVRKIMLLAPALYSDYEVFPAMLKLYKWSATRWLIPRIWKEASKEKLSHQKDLQKYEQDWKNNPNFVVSVHGDKDRIVPYKNSERLKKEFDQNKFELITIKDAGHGFVWANFAQIKEQLLNNLD